jgi:hypothetical protein
MKKISVLIPHYNDERIIICLDEINKTSFRENLILIIQDSISDSRIVKEIQSRLKKDDKLLINKDKGIFDALNILLDNVDTEFFTWIGCDDIINESYNYNEIINLFDDGCDIIQSNVVYFENEINVKTRKIKSYNNSFIKYSLGLPFYHFGSTIRTEIIDKINLRFDISRKTAADFEFFRKLFKSSNKSSVACSSSTIFLGDGGNSSADFKARRKGYTDIFQSFKNIRIIIFPVFLLIRIYFKLKSVVR